jgi:hypothetical protein
MRRGPEMTTVTPPAGPWPNLTDPIVARSPLTV